MGLFGDFINQIAGILGENMRIKRTAKKTQNMDEETMKKFNKTTQLANKQLM